ncbi:MAG: IS200/IS605 family transposase, partial [Flavobacteriales bacterium]|nr:IS200/IS605 family transposase [Flavobacteriales bacterium]
YDLKYHVVRITKYRRKVLVGEVAHRVRELIRMICKQHDVETIKGHVYFDHVHLSISVPPHLSVSDLVKKLKGKSSWKVMSEFKTISEQYWGRHFWGRGYFAANSGNVTDEVIMEYIKNQDVSRPDGDLTISDDKKSSFEDIDPNPPT